MIDCLTSDDLSDPINIKDINNILDFAEIEYDYNCNIFVKDGIIIPFIPLRHRCGVSTALYPLRDSKGLCIWQRVDTNEQLGRRPDVDYIIDKDVRFVGKRTREILYILEDELACLLW